MERAVWRGLSRNGEGRAELVVTKRMGDGLVCCRRNPWSKRGPVGSEGRQPAMKRHILMLAAVLLGCPFASGRVTAFPLTTEIQMLARQVQWYHEEKGVYPQSWAEVESRFGRMKSRAGFDHAKRFAFVPENVPASAYPTESRIIFISREPFRPPATREYPIIQGAYQTVGKRVYVAAVQKGDIVDLQQLYPEYAAQLFEKAGVDLPAPSGLGLYPHERAHRAKMIVWWVVLVVVSVLMVRAVLRRRKVRRGEEVRVAG